MGDRVELLSESVPNPRVDPEVPLPNQMPVTSEIPKSSAVCNATVKWKAKLSSAQPPVTTLLEIPREVSGSQKHVAVPSGTQDAQENPEVVITSVGPTSEVMENGRVERMEGDNLSQNSTWTRHSRPGSLQGSRPGSRYGSRPESRFSQVSGGRVASALVAIGTGSSFTELPGTGKDPTTQAQFTSVNTVDNPLLAAVPSLPVHLAWILFLLNILVPGLGTILAGISMLCCGSQQPNNKQDDLIGPCCTNICVGVSQLFTITFLLIGWIWSITWGVYMVLFAYERKRVIDEETRLRRATKVANAFKAGRAI
ncbi:uncharacterized protein [Diadema setosum]|uniref:uncharacterized protein n=1 Tax=Diadema setosum TaxID=31175 RepID=UPI003B3A38A0